jgi:hypothetical protein
MKKEKEKEKPAAKKMSFKDKLAAKKKEKETPKKKDNTTGRGRPSGVIYVLKDKFQEDLETRFSEAQNTFQEFEETLNKFIESGNKSAAKKAREYLMVLYKSVKDFRKAIQDAKLNGIATKKKD